MECLKLTNSKKKKKKEHFHIESKINLDANTVKNLIK